MGQMIGWGRGSGQNASRFSAMARDGDGRGGDLVDMRVKNFDLQDQVEHSEKF